MPLCPCCGASEAYIGFASVECLNAECKNYKKPEEAKIYCDLNKGDMVYYNSNNHTPTLLGESTGIHPARQLEYHSWVKNTYGKSILQEVRENLAAMQEFLAKRGYGSMDTNYASKDAQITALTLELQKQRLISHKSAQFYHYDKDSGMNYKILTRHVDKSRKFYLFRFKSMRDKEIYCVENVWEGYRHFSEKPLEKVLLFNNKVEALDKLTEFVDVYKELNNEK